MHAVTCLPAVTGAWKAKGGGALYGHTGMYPISKTLIEGTDMIDTVAARARPVAARADPDGRPRGAEERPAGHRRC